MKRTMIVVATVGALALAGCGHKNKSNKNEAAAVTSEAAVPSDSASSGAMSKVSEGDAADATATKAAH